MRFSSISYFNTNRYQHAMQTDEQTAFIHQPTVLDKTTRKQWILYSHHPDLPQPQHSHHNNWQQHCLLDRTALFDFEGVQKSYEQRASERKSFGMCSALSQSLRSHFCVILLTHFLYFCSHSLSVKSSTPCSCNSSKIIHKKLKVFVKKSTFSKKIIFTNKN